jgi:hypothetical protein
VVGDWERGAGVRLGRLSLEYRAVTQSREYRTGPVTHPFGAIIMSWWVSGVPSFLWRPSSIA